MNPADLSRRARAILATLGTILAAAGILVTVTVTDNGPDHGPDKPRGSVSVTIGPAAHRTELELPPAAQAVAAEQAKQEAAGHEEAAHADLRSEAGVSKADRQASAELKPPGQPTLPAHPPLAAVHTPGCSTHLVRNFSSRAGAPVLIVVWHYTVSRDNGSAGVLGNVRWFDSPAAQASSTYIIARLSGYCALTVAEASKAWAQAAYNPWAISVEITAMGDEPGYIVQGAGMARAVALARRFHKVYGIPYRRCAVSGGRVTRTGFCDHADLGALGGGHHDIRRRPGSSEWSVGPILEAAKRADAAAATQPITSSERAACKAVRAYRDRRLAHKPKTAGGTAAFERRLSLVRARGHKCVDGKPVRR